MRLLGSDFEVAAAGEVAVDFFVGDDFLDAIDGGEGSGVHAMDEVASVARNQCGHGQLHPGKDHASVAATGAPSEGFGFQHSDTDAAQGQGPRGCQSRKPGAYDSDVYFFRQGLRGISRRDGYSVEPVVSCLDRNCAPPEGGSLTFPEAYTVAGFDAQSSERQPALSTPSM